MYNLDTLVSQNEVLDRKNAILLSHALNPSFFHSGTKTIPCEYLFFLGKIETGENTQLSPSATTQMSTFQHRLKMLDIL